MSLSLISLSKHSSWSSSSSRSSISSISLQVSAELSLLLLDFESTLLNFLPSLVLCDERKTSSWTIQLMFLLTSTIYLCLHFPVWRCEAESCLDCDPWWAWSTRSTMMTRCSGYYTWPGTRHWGTCQNVTGPGRRSSWVSWPGRETQCPPRTRPPPGTLGTQGSWTQTQSFSVWNTRSSGSGKSLSGAASTVG